MHDHVSRLSTSEPAVERRSPDVISYREVAETTTLGIHAGFKRARELAGTRRVYLLVDLTASGKPDESGMTAIKKGVTSLDPLFISVFTGQGTLVNLLAGYAMASTLGKGRYEIFKTEDEAVAELRRRGASI